MHKVLKKWLKKLGARPVGCVVRLLQIHGLMAYG